MALNVSFLKKASFWSHLGAVVAGVGAGIANGGKPVTIIINTILSLLGGKNDQ